MLILMYRKRGFIYISFINLSIQEKLKLNLFGFTFTFLSSTIPLHILNIYEK